jgi:2-C-methyl-D-erythritol 4-phosphate cytidylyltransferase/2-C-methyl-D-erythritol 4-phosphate cytidylyltransferase/2-C-methyl-D-erythritol 2,4-cyclodiphosphate synthase
MSDPVPNDAPVRCVALVPAAGSGSRAGTAQPKQYEAVAGRAVIAHTLDALAAVPEIAATLVVLAPEDTHFERHVAARTSLWIDRCGGATRAASVLSGLEALRERGEGEATWVLVHDAARCLLRPGAVQRLIATCRGDPVGGLLALPVADTLKAADPGIGEPRVAATVDRQLKWLAQTPQMFRLGLLHRALCEAEAAGAAVTDEASAIERLGLAPRLVAGDFENFKITWPADFELAARLLSSRPI